MYIFLSVTLLAKRKRLACGISHVYIPFSCHSELEVYEKEVFQEFECILHLTQLFVLFHTSNYLKKKPNFILQVT